MDGWGGVKVENEYGFCENSPDAAYLTFLRDLASQLLGPETLLYTTDPPYVAEKGSLWGKQVYSCAPPPSPPLFPHIYTCLGNPCACCKRLRTCLFTAFSPRCCCTVFLLGAVSSLPPASALLREPPMRGDCYIAWVPCVCAGLWTLDLARTWITRLPLRRR